jgi:Ca2+-binding EF-hand superfamily protein
MVFMKRIYCVIVGLCLLGALGPSPARAAKSDGKKAKIIAKYDKNGNGVIDGDEMEAMRRDYAANPDGELKEFDLNGDGKLDDAEIAAIKPGAGSARKEKLRELIAKYDKNSNGVIDDDEVEAVRKDFAAHPDGDLKQFDLNHDGKLDDKEIALIKVGPGKAERLKALVAKYDKNGNGIIDGNEIESMRKAFADGTDKELKRFDVNGDGKLDDQEIAAINAGGGNEKKGKSHGGKSAKAKESTSDN